MYLFRVLSLITMLCLFSQVACARPAENPLNSDYKICYPPQVKQLIGQMNPQAMWENLTVLTNFRDRASTHESGKQAAGWIRDQLDIWIKSSGRKDVTISFIQTDGTWPGTDITFKQPSVVVKMGHSNLPGVIVGAHMDTMASCGEDVSCDRMSPTNRGPRPGADDDGTGVVTVMELARTLFESDIRFKKPVYLVFYAAEEAGYSGSRSVIQYFRKNSMPVEAVMQLDMTGYACKNDLTLWLHLDKYTNKNLTLFLQKLVNFYIKRPVKISTIGIGGSDDMAWGMAGFKTVRPQESVSELDGECKNLFMHSSEDTLDKLSLIHMTDYLKLAIAFTAEMAEPV